MSKRKGVAERFVDWLMRHVSTSVALLLVLLFYPGLGLILPLALGLPTLFLVELNVVGTVLAVVLLMALFNDLFDTVIRRSLVDWTSDLRRLDSTEFEWLVGEIFRREGWSVRETGTIGEPDGNIDLEATRDGGRIIIQCKRWQSRPVGVSEVREFLGTLTRDGLPPDAGVFVTLSNFTPQAREEVARTGLHLVDGSGLHARIEAVRRCEPCPRCGAPMTLNKSQFGWWLRCEVHGCGGKRDLGREPAAAVELLMSPTPSPAS